MLYTEDDNVVVEAPADYVCDLPTTYTRKPLLRFRHNVENNIVVHPKWSLDKNVAHIIKTENYENAQIEGVDFYSRVFVPLVYETIYTGTTVKLFRPSGDLIVEVFAKLHPNDKFCRLTGRQVAQRKLINALNWRCLEDGSYVQIDDLGRTAIINKLVKNKTAQPLNW